jgi:hypothetical protein
MAVDRGKHSLTYDTASLKVDAVADVPAPGRCDDGTDA